MKVGITRAFFLLALLIAIVGLVATNPRLALTEERCETCEIPAEKGGQIFLSETSEVKGCAPDELRKLIYQGQDSVRELLLYVSEGTIALETSRSETPTLQIRFASSNDENPPAENEIVVLSSECPRELGIPLASAILSGLHGEAVEQPADLNCTERACLECRYKALMSDSTGFRCEDCCHIAGMESACLKNGCSFAAYELEAPRRDMEAKLPMSYEQSSPSVKNFKFRFGSRLKPPTSHRSLNDISDFSLTAEKVLSSPRYSSESEGPSGGTILEKCSEVVSGLNSLLQGFSPITRIADDDGFSKCRAREYAGKWYIEAVVETSPWTCTCDLKNCNTSEYVTWRNMLTAAHLNLGNASECAPSWNDIASDKQTGTCTNAWTGDPNFNPQHWGLSVNWIDKDRGICSDFTWTPQWWFTFTLDGPPDESPWPIVGEFVVP